MAVYVDTSALTKLVRPEAESSALRSWLDDRGDRLVSSDLTRTELLRAAARRDAGHVTLAREVLDRLHLAPLTTDITESAGLVLPGPLRSLDAIHVVTAMASGDDLEAFVTYDGRQADAARRLGLRVVSPGRDEPA